MKYLEGSFTVGGKGPAKMWPKCNKPGPDFADEPCTHDWAHRGPCSWEPPTK